MSEKLRIYVRAYKIKNENQAEVVYNKTFQGTLADLEKVEEHLTKEN